MNITTRKKLLIAFAIIQIVILCIQIASLIFVFCNLNILEYWYEYMQIKFNRTEFVVRTSITTGLYAIVVTLMTIYLIKKRKQPKEEFLSKMKLLKIVCFVDILFDGLFSILLIIAAYKKDDGKEPFVKVKKEKAKKDKLTYSKETKKKLKEQKLKRRRGLISQELYEKNVKKILKEESYTKNED